MFFYTIVKLYTYLLVEYEYAINLQMRTKNYK